MFKKLAVAAVIAGGAYAAYHYTQDTGPQYPELDYVPADVALFSGQFEELPITDYLQSFGMMNNASIDQIREDFAQLLENEGDELSVQARFGFELMGELLDSMYDIDQLAENTGLASQSRSLFYHVGLSPVIRLRLADADQFFAMFDRAEAASGMTHELIEIAGQQVRSYTLLNEADTSMQLLVRTDAEWATVTLHGSDFNADLLAQAVALEKPTLSLASSNYLSQIQSTYELRESAIGYIRFDKLMDAITQPQNSALGQDIERLMGDSQKSDLAALRTPQCVADFATLTADFPGVFVDMDYTASAEQGIVIDSRSLFAINNASALQQLAALRGFIPALFKTGIDDSMMAFALGTDVGKLGPNLSKLWLNTANAEFSCEVLVEAQASMKGNNPALALSLTQMAAGVQGMALALNDLDIQQVSQNNFASSDMLLNVSSDDVEGLYAILQASLPPLMEVDLPAVGEHVDISSTVQATAGFALPMFMARGESHLALYVGDEAKQQATTVIAEPLQASGLMSVDVDYKKLFTMIINQLEMAGEPIPPELDQLREQDMEIHFEMDVSEHGLEGVYKIKSQSAGTGKS